MATDNTPPRLRLIVTIAVIVVITLVGLNFVFESYYAYMTDEARAEKVAPKKALLAQLEVEQQSFAGAKVPLDQAMKEVATRPDIVEPKPSDDMTALTGWGKLPKALPASMPAQTGAGAAPAAADAGAMPAGDAGAMMAGDAGAAPMMTDAGAPAMNDAGKPSPKH